MISLRGAALATAGVRATTVRAFAVRATTARYQAGLIAAAATTAAATAGKGAVEAAAEHTTKKVMDGESPLGGSSGAATATKAASSKPAAKGSSLRDRLAAFLTGIAFGGLGGYYVLHQDIWESSEQLQSRVDKLNADVSVANATLHQRVLALEQQLEELQRTRRR